MQPVPVVRSERQSGGYSAETDSNDHVDYGAYTGSNGAFGWYSDHPVIVFLNDK